jgi:Asp-tRNA(Asn)/Glu-tRNA(Gln) amidotransferase A subunit family amidase
MNPCFETATRLARAIRNGRLSSVDATQAHLQRIERLNGPINALVVVDRDGALKAARAADRAQAKKNRLGPLHGVPITIKEAFDVAGLHTTSSHPPLKDNVAREDASLVARLRAAGAVILGKTNVPELCADFQTDSPLFGTTKNAWDHRRTAGGSTGGGAVAVAARLSPLELGSDIGGSVRNPAHYNGIFSLKPTEWRVPGRGHVPNLPGQTRTVRWMGVFGPLARSVGRTARLDLAEFLAVLERRDLIMRQCEAFLDDYDAWLMPVMPDAAFIRQKQSAPLVIDGTPHPYFFAGTSYNFLANLTGQPSIVLPCGFSKEGLPIGLQLTGRKWDDAKLLGIAKALEKLLPPCPVPPNYRGG